MADKLNEFAKNLGKGGAPKGLGLGVKLLAGAAAAVYGLQQSIYTGNHPLLHHSGFCILNNFL